ncbi:MAG: hypothetical protein U0525_04835 [Patescibacteria group bacterium]
MNATSLFLFATIASLTLHFFLLIPFINYLYARKMMRVNQETKDPFGKITPIFDKFNSHKVGTPVGGGILIIILTSIIYLGYLLWFLVKRSDFSANYPSLIAEILIILFTFVSFGMLGLYDDLVKIFLWKRHQFFGLRMRQKFIIQVVLALIVSLLLNLVLKIDIIHIPFIGTYHISYWYIIFSSFVIIAFSNAMNITDGLDGLSSGILLIALTAFWVVARSIIDVPTSLFIAIWLGGLIAFLYFNVYPARIMLGDTGALSFGATFAVIGLIIGKTFALPVIGGVFFIEIFMSGTQLIYKKIFKKKLYPVAPFHLFLQHKGWQEPKVVFRLWLLAFTFAVIGLAIAFLK